MSCRIQLVGMEMKRQSDSRMLGESDGSRMLGESDGSRMLGESDGAALQKLRKSG